MYAVGDAGGVHAFALGGTDRFSGDDAARRRWSFEIDDSFLPGEAIADGGSFVATQTSETTLYCLSAE